MKPEKEQSACGCTMERDKYGILSLTYCPMHKAAPKLYEAGKNALVSLRLWANEHPDDKILAMVIAQIGYTLTKAKGK